MDLILIRYNVISMFFKFIKQPDAMDCGPACLSMVAKYYGKDYNVERLRKQSFIGRDGVSLLGISRAADDIGFRTIGGTVSFDMLVDKVPLPCIIHWNQNHFVVLYKVESKRKSTVLYVADPGIGLVQYSQKEFQSQWISTTTNGEEVGVGIVIRAYTFVLSKKR